MLLAVVVLGYLVVRLGLGIREHRSLTAAASQREGGEFALSLVCVVQNRADIIEGFLRGLSALRQTFPDTEIIVVDNNSVDETAAIAEKLARGHSHLYVLRMADQPAGANPAACGSLYARGRMVCCINLERCRKPLAVIRLLERSFRVRKWEGETGMVTWLDRGTG